MSNSPHLRGGRHFCFLLPTIYKCPRYDNNRRQPTLIQTFPDFSSDDIHSTLKCFTSVNSSISVLCTISELSAPRAFEIFYPA